jgi:sec-independent protein translocase protein TatB
VVAAAATAVAEQRPVRAVERLPEGEPAPFDSEAT